MIGVSVGEMPEFLSQAETVLHVLWRYKIFCDLYATVQIVNLVRGSSRDEDSVTQELHNGPALHTILFKESLSEDLVQIPTLVMNWVMIWRILLALLFSNLPEQLSDLLCILRCINVP